MGGITTDLSKQSNSLKFNAPFTPIGANDKLILEQTLLSKDPQKTTTPTTGKPTELSQLSDKIETLFVDYYKDDLNKLKLEQSLDLNKDKDKAKEDAEKAKELYALPSIFQPLPIFNQNTETVKTKEKPQQRETQDRTFELGAYDIRERSLKPKQYNDDRPISVGYKTNIAAPLWLNNREGGLNSGAYLNNTNSHSLPGNDVLTNKNLFGESSREIPIKTVTYKQNGSSIVHKNLSNGKLISETTIGFNFEKLVLPKPETDTKVPKIIFDEVNNRAIIQNIVNNNLQISKIEGQQIQNSAFETVTFKPQNSQEQTFAAPQIQYWLSDAKERANQQNNIVFEVNTLGLENSTKPTSRAIVSEKLVPETGDKTFTIPQNAVAEIEEQYPEDLTLDLKRKQAAGARAIQNQKTLSKPDNEFNLPTLREPSDKEKKISPSISKININENNEPLNQQTQNKQQYIQNSNNQKNISSPPFGDLPQTEQTSKISKISSQNTPNLLSEARQTNAQSRTKEGQVNVSPDNIIFIKSNSTKQTLQSYGLEYSSPNISVNSSGIDKKISNLMPLRNVNINPSADNIKNYESPRMVVNLAEFKPFKIASNGDITFQYTNQAKQGVQYKASVNQTSSNLIQNNFIYSDQRVNGKLNNANLDITKSLTASNIKLSDFSELPQKKLSNFQYERLPNLVTQSISRFGNNIENINLASQQSTMSEVRQRVESGILTTNIQIPSKIQFNGLVQNIDLAALPVQKNNNSSQFTVLKTTKASTSNSNEFFNIQQKYIVNLNMNIDAKQIKDLNLPKLNTFSSNTNLNTVFINNGNYKNINLEQLNQVSYVQTNKPNPNETQLLRSQKLAPQNQNFFQSAKPLDIPSNSNLQTLRINTETVKSNFKTLTNIQNQTPVQNIDLAALPAQKNNNSSQTLELKTFKVSAGNSSTYTDFRQYSTVNTKKPINIEQVSTDLLKNSTNTKSSFVNNISFNYTNKQYFNFNNTDQLNNSSQQLLIGEKSKNSIQTSSTSLNLKTSYEKTLMNSSNVDVNFYNKKTSSINELSSKNKSINATQNVDLLSLPTQKNSYAAKASQVIEGLEQKLGRHSTFNSSQNDTALLLQMRKVSATMHQGSHKWETNLHENDKRSLTDPIGTRNTEKKSKFINALGAVEQRNSQISKLIASATQPEVNTIKLNGNAQQILVSEKNGQINLGLLAQLVAEKDRGKRAVMNVLEKDLNRKRKISKSKNEDSDENSVENVQMFESPEATQELDRNDEDGHAVVYKTIASITSVMQISAQEGASQVKIIQKLGVIGASTVSTSDEMWQNLTTQMSITTHGIRKVKGSLTTDIREIVGDIQNSAPSFKLRGLKNSSRQFTFSGNIHAAPAFIYQERQKRFG